MYVCKHGGHSTGKPRLFLVVSMVCNSTVDEELLLVLLNLIA